MTTTTTKKSHRLTLDGLLAALPSDLAKKIAASKKTGSVASLLNACRSQLALPRDQVTIESRETYGDMRRALKRLGISTQAAPVILAAARSCTENAD